MIKIEIWPCVSCHLYMYVDVCICISVYMCCRWDFSCDHWHMWKNKRSLCLCHSSCICVYVCVYLFLCCTYVSLSIYLCTYVFKGIYLYLYIYIYVFRWFCVDIYYYCTQHTILLTVECFCEYMVFLFLSRRVSPCTRQWWLTLFQSCIHETPFDYFDSLIWLNSILCISFWSRNKKDL